MPVLYLPEYSFHMESISFDPFLLLHEKNSTQQLSPTQLQILAPQK